MQPGDYVDQYDDDEGSSASDASDVEMEDAAIESGSEAEGPEVDDDPMDGVLGENAAAGSSDAIRDLNINAHDLMQLDTAMDLQTESLLEEVSVKVPARVRETLMAIKSALEGAPATGSLAHDAALKHLAKRGVAWPWAIDLGREAIQYKFGYAAPERVDVVGSFLIGGTNKGALVKRRGGFNVDVAVQMPSDLFQPKDHLNYRYFHKRAFYLAHAASILKAAGLRVEFAYDRNDTRRPMLAVTVPLAKKLGGPAVVHVRPTVAATVFNADKLAPGRNNVRPAADAPAMDPLPATPAYNAALLSDMHQLSHLHTLHKAAGVVGSLPEALKLIKVWCEQRALNAWAFPLSYLAAALALKNQVGRDLKAIQVFRLVMFYLANHDFAAPLMMLGDHADPDAFSVSEVAMVDQDGVNLTTWAGRSDATRLQLEATKAATLATAGEAGALFLTPKIAPQSTFDHLVRIPLPATAPAFYNPRVRLDDPSLAHFLSLAVPRLLARALTTRVKLIAHVGDPSAFPTATWSVDAEAPGSATATPGDALTFGLVFHPTEYARAVDIGPSPQDEAAALAFRRLWGAKAELRRFPDGSILESVAWGAKTAPTKIVAAAIDHVVARHMGVTSGVAHHGQHPLHKLLRGVERASAAGTATTVSVDEAFRELAALITGLDEMPLPVAAVLPLSPELTRTAVAAHRHRATFAVELEASGKWPTEPEALYHMTLLFLAQYATQLETKHGLKATVVTSPLSLDVDFSGYAFKMVVKPKSSVALRDELRHAGDMSNLTLVYPGFAATVRGFKYLVARHMLGYQIHDHVAELLVAHVFTSPASEHVAAPVDALAGVVRTLALVVRHPWTAEALGVVTRVATPSRSKSAMALNGGSLADDEDESATAQTPAEAAAKAQREAASKRPPTGALVAPPAEGTVVVSSHHKRYTVELLAMKRLRAVAKAALAVLSPAGANLTPVKAKALAAVYTPAAADLTAFDVTVHLRSEIVGAYVVSGCARLAAEHPGFNPVEQWLADVARTYGSLVRTFHNDVDGGVVGVVVDPRRLVPRRWDHAALVGGEVSNAKFLVARRSRAAADDSDSDDDAAAAGGDAVRMVPNVEAVTSDVARMGEGLVDRVVIQRPAEVLIGGDDSDSGSDSDEAMSEDEDSE
ncbi:U3 snoRNP protein [Blastocladiella emersonii ATCC 22665]|nr:U3 snoRNP protein [Blastocladiella emersonii ATCC 22665]